jgi:hypothetical protein
MVNKQVIDNILYTMDNEVRNPFVQSNEEKRRENILSLFFFSSLIEERRNTCSLLFLYP